MIWDTKETTYLKSDINSKTASKQWKNLGNAVEIIQKSNVIPSKKVEETSQIIKNKKFEDSIKIIVGDIVFVNSKWAQVLEIKGENFVYSINGEKNESALNLAKKKIPIKIMVCTLNLQNIVLVDVGGRLTLKKLGIKLAKLLNAKCGKADWHFNGKLIDKPMDQTIESIKINPMDKLTCVMLGYEIKTYKRFPKVDNRGWYMSNSSKDSISFIPSKPILLFGFGMYYTREGPPSYTLGYELFLEGESIVKDSVVINKVQPDDEIYKINFQKNGEPFEVNAATKISICCSYEHFEDASRLVVGADGSKYKDIEGNEPGLFEIQAHSDSGNGTDINSGQIPELYYSLR